MTSERIQKIIKSVSILGVAAFMITALPLNVMGETLSTEDNNELVFAVLSDVHIKNSKTAEDEKFAKALKIINREAPDLDAVLFAGDLTDSGSVNQYDKFNSIYNANKNPNARRLAVMGNHDYWNGLSASEAQELFVDKLGVQAKNSVNIINGYYFINVSPDGGSTNGEFGTETLNWVKKSLEEAKKADSNKPIFLTVHQHISGTVYGSDLWGNPALDKVLKDYPQVVTFSGHSHYPLNDERSIHQRDYTSVGTASLSYVELESGKINGSVPPNAANYSQGLIVRVKGNDIDIERLDFNNDVKIKNNWTIQDAGDKSKYKYTDDRIILRDKPYFEENAKIDIDKLESNSVTIRFDQGKHSDFVHSYKIQAINKATGKVDKEVLAFSEFYFGIKMPKNLTFAINGLGKNTNYEIRVYAIESFGKVSDNYLLTDIRTVDSWKSNEKYEVGNIVSFDGNRYVCIQSHSAQESWTPDEEDSLWIKELGQGADLWKVNKKYKVGDQVRSNNQSYICIQNHKSQGTWNAEVSSSLWKMIE